VDYRQLQAFDADPNVQKELAAIRVPSMLSLLGEAMLYGASLRAALEALPGLSNRPPDFASTDLYPYLEYQTPKGNTLPQTTVYENINFMLRYRPPDPLHPDIRLLNVPSEDERNLLRGYAAAQRGDGRTAAEYLRRVAGPARAQAERELTRMESGAHGPRKLGR
jgi:hypothetical protein